MKNYSDIDISQISMVLDCKYSIDIPDWEISSIKKYDDGFTYPSVIITYLNGVTLQLSRKEMGYADYIPIEKIIGSNKINIYNVKDKIIYRLHRNIGYSFEMNKNQQILIVEQYILTLN